MCNALQIEHEGNIGRGIHLRTDHGKEFENLDFSDFCSSNGISHEYFAPRKELLKE